ncbi:MAG: plastocyanin/azurin family copper-binding protein, partial [Verrucomicrobiota bacterium]
ASRIPVDLTVGPRGDAYVCDWYNPVKGHMQYSLRDERRSRTSGRIWRIVPKGATLATPPKIDGASVAELLDLLKSPHYRYRYWAKRELRLQPAATVKTALDRWVAQLDPKVPEFRHHQIEAIWTYRTLGAVNAPLLAEVLACDNPHARAAATQQLRYWFASVPDVAAQLKARANDDNPLVRLEAVIAASYIGTRAALEAIAGALDKPAGAHLKYAIRTALGSEALSRHWKADTKSFAKFASYVETVEKSDKAGKARKAPKLDTGESTFDRQPDLTTVTISTLRERMLYDKTEFTVKPNQPVKLVFNNTDATPHNLVIVAPGAADEVGMAGNEMAKDPSGIKAHFVPKTDKVLFATKLLDAEGTTTLRFKAPATPGDYPYVCTFPGHWVMMRGVMHVK